MKKLFLFLTLLATVWLIASCDGVGGGSGSAGLVGAWGLTHYESFEYEDGELVYSEIEDYDLDNPVGKWEIKYYDALEITIIIAYIYNDDLDDWERVDEIHYHYRIKNGEVKYWSDYNRTESFYVSGNTLTVTYEYSYESLGVIFSKRTKRTFKRLSAPETDTNTITDVPDFI